MQVLGIMHVLGFGLDVLACIDALTNDTVNNNSSKWPLLYI